MTRLITSILLTAAIGTCACDGETTGADPDDSSSDTSVDSTDTTDNTDNADGQITESTVTPDGIYEILSWTRNSSSCDSAGSDEQGTLIYVVAASTTPFDQTVFKLVNCETLEECREIQQLLVSDIDLGYTWSRASWEFSRTVSDGFSGAAATVNAGMPDDEGMCYEYAVDRLELSVQGETLTIVIEHTASDVYPPDALGACTEADAIAASVGNPCYNRSDLTLQKIAD